MLSQFQLITTFIFDMDGVLTDGSLLALPGGVMARRMNVKDGYALQLAVKKGYNAIIISGGYSVEAEERFNKLGIKNVWMKVTDKLKVATDYLQQNNTDWSHVLFMGDDIPDLEMMQHAGVACCPADAVTEIKAVAHYISPIGGGMGCVREVIEKVMKLRNDWNEDVHVPSA